MKCLNCPWSEEVECHGKDEPEYNFEKDKIEKIVEDAFEAFVKEDYYLVTHEINEVAIVAGFYFHIRQLIQQSYPKLNVDIEYDKNVDTRKKYGDEYYARPDLIIHKRGCNKYNVLYMEFKKRNNGRRDVDFKKLEEFTKKQEQSIKIRNGKFAYRYRYGMFIEIEENGFNITWYINGKKENSLRLSRERFED